jgi:hypothetical protein
MKVQNGYECGLVTLLEMLQFYASVFVDVANLLREMEALASILSGQSENVSKEDTYRVKNCALFLKRICDTHGWTLTSKKCDRILAHVAHNDPITHDYLHPALRDLRERVEDELGDQYFLHLKSTDAAMFEDPLLKWESVVSRFPLVRNNIEESSKCFALERYGAAVFHILLVAEYGVIEVSRLLGVEGDKPGWSSLGRLSKLISIEYLKRDPLAQKHSMLLESVVPLAFVVKDSWRHKLTHVDNQLIWQDTDFSPAVAEEIITATRGFMRKLASELPNDGKAKFRLSNAEDPERIQGRATEAIGSGEIKEVGT